VWLHAAVVVVGARFCLAGRAGACGASVCVETLSALKRRPWPMKILLVSEDLPAPAVGGLGKQLLALGNALIAAGHEVALMGRDTPSYDSCAAEMAFSGRFIAGFGDPFRGWKERQLGVFVPGKRSYFAWRIAQGILRHAAGFDVVHYHGHHPMVGRYLPAGLNFLQTRHDQGSDCVIHTRFRSDDVCTQTDPRACARCIHPSPGPLRTMVSAAAIRSYRRHTAEAFLRHPVVFVSSFLQRNAGRTLGDAAYRKALVIHNFVDEAALAAVPSLPAAGSTRIVVAGRIEPAKGIYSLLQFLAPLLSTPWSIEVYGGGPQDQEAKRAFASYPGIVFHGHASHQAVLAAMAGARVVVMPSVWEEAFGLVTLEALKLGRACYALERGGTPELARYGAPGQLRLFSNLRSLVLQLLQDLPELGAFGPGESADIAPRLADTLAAYGEQ